MNGYPPYASAAATGQQQGQFSDPRLPPRPAVPPPPPQQQYPPPQNRNSFDYPSFPPPISAPYQSGPPQPPQHHAGPSSYMNEPPGREPRYDGNGYPPRDGNPDPYSQGPHAGYQNGNAQNQRPPAQNGQGYGQDHRRQEPVPVLPPMRFADRPPQFPPYSGDRGAPGPGAPPYPGQDYPREYSAPGQYPRRDGSRDRGRDNFRGNGDQQGRARSPDQSRRPPRPLGDRDRDARTADHRTQLERACRTLFVRNVSYEADAEALRTAFEQFGDIKTYFDLVKQRGMIFITYFDTRAADKARDGMHDSLVKGRKIDVHYSLPKDEDQKSSALRDSNQGSVLVHFLGSKPISDNDLGQVCEQYGQIKSIRPGRSPGRKVVEFYDARAATLFYDTMNNRPSHGGILELRFIWDEPDKGAPPPPPHGGRGGRPPVNGRREGGRASSRERGGRDGGPRNDYRNGGPMGDRRDSGPQLGRYNDEPPSMTEDRLEQARKVQNLLATLGGPPPPSSGPPQRPAPQQEYRNGNIGHSTPMNQPPIQPPPSMSPVQRSFDPRLGSNGAGSAQTTPGGFKGSNGGPGPQAYNYPSTGGPAPPYASGPGGGIPPEVLSLLQANNVAAPPTQQQAPPFPPPQYPARPPPPAANNGQFRPPTAMPPGPSQGHGQRPPPGQQQGYQPGPASGDVGSLLAMLQQNR